MYYSQCFTRFVIDLITMILRSSYTQSVLSVYPIYTEDIIERYLIKSVNISDGRVGKAGRLGGLGGLGRLGQVGQVGQVGRVGRVGVRAAPAIVGQEGRVG